MQPIARHLRPEVVAALAESRVACLLGARQVGKSTLVRWIAREEHPARYLTLDDQDALQAARHDPTGFVAGTERLVIDEVQRAPDLMLAIKQRVDDNDARGQFLLTGSANLLTLPQIADALPGRVAYLRLWPFTQGELGGVRERFVDETFAGRAPQLSGQEVGRRFYADRVVRGGFPEAVEASAARRAGFVRDYADSILGREVSDLTSVRDVEAVSRVLRLTAARSAAIANTAAIAREVGIDHKTVGSYLWVLEQLFLVLRLPAWRTNLGHRVIKSPKLHIADTGLLCGVIGVDAARLESDGNVAGGVFESFAAAEVIRQMSYSDLGPFLSASHYRDQRGNEVDLLLEHADGRVVGIEVKASATPRPEDGRGLALLRDRLGDRFVLGVVLHVGRATLPFGDRIWAVPLGGLWDG